MSSAHYIRQFRAANKKGWPRKLAHLRGVKRKYNAHRRDVLGKRLIDRW